MKRYISIFLTLVLVLGAVVTPVAAAETAVDSWFPVLDYATPNDSGNMFAYFNGSGTFNFKVQGTRAFYGFDILCNINDVTSASVVIDGRTFALNVLHIGDDLYRFYGNVGGGLTKNNFDLVLTSSGDSYCTFLKVDVLSVAHSSYDDVGFFAVGSASGNSPFQYMNTPGVGVSYNFGGESSSAMGDDYTVYTYVSNWKKYDYVDIFFSIRALSLASLSVYCGDRALPFVISYFDSGADTWYQGDQVDSGVNQETIGNIRDFAGYVRVDLRDLDLSSSASLCLEYHGTYLVNNVRNSFSLQAVTGYVDTNTINPLQIYFSNLTTSLKGWFSSLGSTVSTGFSNLNSWLDTQTSTIVSAVNSKFTSLKSWIETQTSTLEAAIRGDASAGDEFNEDLQEQASDLADVGAVMDSVERPDIDEVDVSVDAYIDPSVLSTSMEGLAAVMNNELILSILMMSLVMAVASYVLYGKR